jgi:hypothetical protein
MRATVTPEAESAIADLAQRYAISREAVLAMLIAVNNGGGTMAQFSIPELGGSGQWMRGGMTMVGNMFDNALKARVDGLCRELSQLLSTTTVFPPANSSSQSQGGFTSSNWWPTDLGVPSSSGAQNNARYAIFPGTRRLAIQVDGVTRVFDTGEHRIGGVQQQQGGAYGSVNFTSQFGTFDVSNLRELGAHEVAETPVAGPAHPEPAQDVFEPAPSVNQDQAPQNYAAQNQVPRNQVPQNQAPQTQAPQNQAPQNQAPQNQAPRDQAPTAGQSGDPNGIIAAIESLAGLHQRGILSDEEFSAKKAELLGRL